MKDNTLKAICIGMFFGVCGAALSIDVAAGVIITFMGIIIIPMIDAVLSGS